MLLSETLLNDELRRKIEADFRQYYSCDLRDLWVDESPVTVRWVIDMIDELPYDSRFVKDLRNDPLNGSDNLQLMIVDALNQILFQSSLSAAADLGKEYKKYVKKAPKPIERPQIREDKKEKRFVSIHELKAMMKL